VSFLAFQVKLRAHEGFSRSFKKADGILSTRINLLRAIRMHEETDAIGDNFSSVLHREARDTERACLVSLSAVARESGHLQASMNAVTQAHKLVESGSRVDDVDEELAMVLWAQGEHGTAIALLETVSNRQPNKKALVWARLVSVVVLLILVGLF
jgi:ataxia telangiectasia mutated family protein